IFPPTSSARPSRWRRVGPSTRWPTEGPVGLQQSETRKVENTDSWPDLICTTIPLEARRSLDALADRETGRPPAERDAEGREHGFLARPHLHDHPAGGASVPRRAGRPRDRSASSRARRGRSRTRILGPTSSARPSRWRRVGPSTRWPTERPVGLQQSETR